MSPLSRIAYRRDNSALAGLWTVVLLMVVLAEVCGCSAGAREKALTGAYVATVASEAALLKYDQGRAQDIIAGAPDEATGKLQLADWRTKVTKVEKDIGIAINAIAAGFALNSDPSLTTALAAAALIQQDLNALGVKP